MCITCELKSSNCRNFSPKNEVYCATHVCRCSRTSSFWTQATTSWWPWRVWKVWYISKSWTCAGTSWPRPEKTRRCWGSTRPPCWSSTPASTPGNRWCVLALSRHNTTRARVTTVLISLQPKAVRMTILSRLTTLTHLDDVIITEEEAAKAAQVAVSSKINQVSI